METVVAHVKLMVSHMITGKPTMLSVGARWTHFNRPIIMGSLVNDDSESRPLVKRFDRG